MQILVNIYPRVNWSCIRLTTCVVLFCSSPYSSAFAVAQSGSDACCRRAWICDKALLAPFEDWIRAPETAAANVRSVLSSFFRMVMAISS